MTQTQQAPAGPAPSISPPAAVALHGVTKHFGPVTAVDGLDLTVQAGEVVAFLGPNGAGKTTTIDMLLGLTRPDSGSARVFGLAPRTAVAQGLVAAVMQTGGLLKDLTVAETVQLTAALFAHSRPVAEVLDRAGLAAIADRRGGGGGGPGGPGRDRRRGRGEVLGGPAAGVAFRDGAPARAGVAGAGRADDR